MGSGTLCRVCCGGHTLALNPYKSVDVLEATSLQCLGYFSQQRLVRNFRICGKVRTWCRSLTWLQLGVNLLLSGKWFGSSDDPKDQELL